MKKDKAVISKLEKSETGILKGGFSLQTTFDVAGKFLGNNVNCIGGGWFDTRLSNLMYHTSISFCLLYCRL